MQDIKDYLSYEPITGVFTWIKSPADHIKIGYVAGCKDKEGYIKIRFTKIGYRAHRLAWWFIYGEMPDCKIDHINEVRDDNRISNLRLDVNKENEQNSSKPQKNNTSGYLGVNWSITCNKWESRISVKGKRIVIGYYDTPEEAHAAYLCAKKKHHPFWVENK
jgi:hypothetical protein